MEVTEMKNCDNDKISGQEGYYAKYPCDISEYKVVKDDSLTTLQKTVTYLLGEAWHLRGDLMVCETKKLGVLYYQTMVRYSKR